MGNGLSYNATTKFRSGKYAFDPTISNTSLRKGLQGAAGTARTRRPGPLRRRREKAPGAIRQAASAHTRPIDQ